ncbi:MAG: hypothetical protein KKH98_10555, partial [Spirochaetes bacterium]|nr:hypothetical protein [Spirochaetota bacterium]
QFFGGEPLLRWDLIKEGAEYFKKKTARLKKNKSISLATNGLLLNVEKTGFLKKIHKDFNVIFSFDGVLSQNLNRSPFKKKSADASFDSILKNLDNLIKAKLPFFVNMVVGPRNLDDVEKNIELLIAKGVTSIRLSYMMGVFWEKHMIKKFLDRVRKVYLNYKRQDLLVDIGHCHDEPVLISSGLTLMPDERLFVGTTYPLLNMFPHIKEFNCYGKLGDYTNFAQIRRNKRKEVQKSLTLLSTKGEKEFSLLANNIYLGICYEKLFKELENE